MSRAGDPAILAYAREHRMACVTLDHDFHAHLAQTSADGPSVVFLRAEGMGAVEQAGLIESVWLTCEEAIDAGGAISADGSTVRLRRLPLK